MKGTFGCAVLNLHLLQALATAPTFFLPFKIQKYERKRPKVRSMLLWQYMSWKERTIVLVRLCAPRMTGCLVSYGKDPRSSRPPTRIIRFRIRFKIDTLVYRCINGIAPVYLSELVNLHVPGRSGHRSECDALKLVVHRYRLKRYGERSFLASAPVIWNALPLSLRSCTSLLSFRKNLKTYLFKKAFDLT